MKKYPPSAYKVGFFVQIVKFLRLKINLKDTFRQKQILV